MFYLSRILCVFLASVCLPLAGCVSTDGIEQTIQTEMDELQEPIDKLEQHMQTIAENSAQMTEYLKSVSTLETALMSLAERLEQALQDSAGSYEAELRTIGENIEKLTAQIAAARLVAEKAIEAQNGSRR